MEERERAIEKKIEELAEPIIKRMGLELVDIEFKSGGRESLLRIFVDRPRGEGHITLRELEALSNEISIMLDVEDPIAESYTLEVSSPGLDRELRKEREIKWAVGKKVVAHLDDGRSVEGRLEKVEDDRLHIGGREVERSRIRKLKLNEV